MKKPVKQKKAPVVSGLEEVSYECPTCGRIVKIVKEAGEQLVVVPCERCVKGEADIDRE